MPDNTLRLSVDASEASKSVRELSNEFKGLLSAVGDMKTGKSSGDSEEVKRLKAQIEELIRVAVSGNGELKAFVESIKAGAAPIETLDQKLARLTSTIEGGTLVSKAQTQAIKEAQMAAKQRFTDEELAAGAAERTAEVVRAAKDKQKEATTGFLSTQALERESYFSTGNALRTAALASGGYVTQLQAQQIAERLATLAGIDQAQAMKLVQQAAEQQSVTILQNAQVNEQLGQTLLQVKAQLLAQAEASGGVVSAENQVTLSEKLAAGAGLEQVEAMKLLQSIAQQSSVALEENAAVTRSLRDIVREARQEARMFTFAILEVTRGFEAISKDISVFSGATEEGKAKISSFTTSVRDAVAAGLGLSFGLKALGPAFEALAGPVGLAVGALTLIATAISEANKHISELADKQLKNLSDGLKELNFTDLALEIDAVNAKLMTLDKTIGELSTNAVKHGDEVGALGQMIGDALFPSKALEGAKASTEAQQKYRDALEETREKLLTNAVAITDFAEKRFKLGIITADQYVTELKYAEAIAKSKNESLLVADIEKRISDERSGETKAAEKSIEDRYKLHEITVAQYRVALETELSNAKTDADKLTALEKIKSLNSDVLTNLRAQHESNSIDTQEYYAKLVAIKAITTDVAERGRIEKDLQQILLQQGADVERKLKAGEISVSQAQQEIGLLVGAADASGKVVLSKEQILALQTKINELVAKQAKDEQGLADDLASAQIANIASSYQRQLAGEQARHDKRLKDIDSEVAADDTVGNHQHLRQQLLSAEQIMNENIRRDLIFTHDEESRQLQIDAMDEGTAKIIAQRDLDLALIQRNLDAGKIEDKEARFKVDIVMNKASIQEVDEALKTLEPEIEILKGGFGELNSFIGSELSRSMGQATNAFAAFAQGAVRALVSVIEKLIEAVIEAAILKLILSFFTGGTGAFFSGAGIVPGIGGRGMPAPTTSIAPGLGGGGGIGASFGRAQLGPLPAFAEGGVIPSGARLSSSVGSEASPYVQAPPISDRQLATMTGQPAEPQHIILEVNAHSTIDNDHIGVAWRSWQLIHRKSGGNV